MQKIDQQPQSIQNLLKLHPECDFLKRFYTSKGIRVPAEIKTTEEWIPVLELLPGPDTVPKSILDLSTPEPVTPRVREPGLEIRIAYSEKEWGTCKYEEQVYFRGSMHVPVSVLRRGNDAIMEYISEDYYDYCEEYERIDEETSDHESSDREGNNDLECCDNLSRIVARFFETHPELREVPANEQEEEET